MKNVLTKKKIEKKKNCLKKIKRKNKRIMMILNKKNS